MVPQQAEWSTGATRPREDRPQGLEGQVKLVLGERGVAEGVREAFGGAWPVW